MRRKVPRIELVNTHLAVMAHYRHFEGTLRSVYLEHEAETYAHVKPTCTLLWGPTGTGKSMFSWSVFEPARTFVMMFGD